MTPDHNEVESTNRYIRKELIFSTIRHFVEPNLRLIGPWLTVTACPGNSESRSKWTLLLVIKVPVEELVLLSYYLSSMLFRSDSFY